MTRTRDLPRFGTQLLSGLAALLSAAPGVAQTIGAPSGPAGDSTTTTAAPGPVTVNVTAPPPTQTTTTTYGVVGLPPPGTQLEGYLPSSSRAVTDTSRSSDGFDLNQERAATGPLKGNADNLGVVSSQSPNVPGVHQVRRGDTLWDLSNGYFQNPWLWPKVWSLNPQIHNPHWIYPGDQVRLRNDVPAAQRSAITLGANSNGGQGGGAFSTRRQKVSKGTVFLRSEAYIDDPKKDVWGELVGAQEEQMLLTEGNSAYVILRPGVDASIGQLLTIFRSVRTPDKVPGARRPPGEIIAIKGTLRVETFDPKTRIARGPLIESLDTIERGDKVGPVGRRFEVLAPKPNTVEVEARVLTSLYPHEVIGQNQIAFIDRGWRDGLAAGNRLFLVERGDAWRATLATATTMARSRVRTDVPEHVKVEVMPLHGKTEDFPDEIVGELRVLRADEHSSVTLVTAAKHEIEAGDRAVTKQGY